MYPHPTLKQGMLALIVLLSLFLQNCNNNYTPNLESSSDVINIDLSHLCTSNRSSDKKPTKRILSLISFRKKSKTTSQEDNISEENVDCASNLDCLESGSSSSVRFNLGTKKYNLKAALQENKLKEFESLNKAVEAGDPAVQFELGVFYSKEEGVEQDEYRAADLFKMAAKQGHAKAQCHLGLCYTTGKGINQNEKKAVKWFEKAAVQGNEDAQFHLGLCYEKGIGVARDKIEAVNLFRMAAKQGHINALQILAIYYANGKEGPRNKAKELKYSKKDLEEKLAQARFNAKKYYYNSNRLLTKPRI